MVTVVLILTGIVFAAVLAFACLLWNLQRQVRSFQTYFTDELDIKPMQASVFGLKEDLSVNFLELKEGMSHMAKALKVLSQEIYHLNLLARYLLNGSEQPGNSQDSPGSSSPNAHLIIEIRPTGHDYPENEHALATTNLSSPEMLEQFQTFQNLYRTLLSRQDLPSQNTPELN